VAATHTVHCARAPCVLGEGDEELFTFCCKDMKRTGLGHCKGNLS